MKDNKTQYDRVGDREPIHFFNRENGPGTTILEFIITVGACIAVAYILIIVACQVQQLQNSYYKPKAVVMQEQVFKQLPQVPSYKLITLE